MMIVDKERSTDVATVGFGICVVSPGLHHCVTALCHVTDMRPVLRTCNVSHSCRQSTQNATDCAPSLCISRKGCHRPTAVRIVGSFQTRFAIVTAAILHW